MDGPGVPSEKTCDKYSDMHCVRLHCHAEVSHLVIGHSFGPLKGHLEGGGESRRLHNNKEMEKLFVNICECKILICTVTGFLNF
jgi:hypothetical protein